MDEVDNPVSQVPRKVGAVIDTAVAAQTAGHEDLGPAIAERELHIRIGFVVAQQDVEARLALLDEVVFQRQRLVLVVDQDVVDVDRVAHQRSGLGVGLGGFQQIGANPRAKILRLADVNHFSVGVLIEVHAGPGR